MAATSSMQKKKKSAALWTVDLKKIKQAPTFYASNTSVMNLCQKVFGNEHCNFNYDHPFFTSTRMFLELNMEDGGFDATRVPNINFFKSKMFGWYSARIEAGVSELMTLGNTMKSHEPLDVASGAHSQISIDTLFITWAVLSIISDRNYPKTVSLLFECFPDDIELREFFKVEGTEENIFLTPEILYSIIQKMFFVTRVPANPQEHEIVYVKLDSRVTHQLVASLQKKGETELCTQLLDQANIVLIDQVRYFKVDYMLVLNYVILDFVNNIGSSWSINNDIFF